MVSKGRKGTIRIGCGEEDRREESMRGGEEIARRWGGRGGEICRRRMIR